MLSRCFIAVFAVLLALPGCTCHPKSSDTATGPGTPSHAIEKQVNLAIWANYLSDEMVKSFTDKTGIQVAVTNYSSNEELLAKLQAGGDGYDVIVPSDYMVSVMTTLGLVQRLDKSRFSNFAQIESKFLNKSYDPGNVFSVPYAWTVTGMAVNRQVFKEPIKGWADAFANPALAGKISLLDDSREVLGVALRLIGKSLNTTDAADLDAAKKTIAAFKPRVKAFTSEPIDGISSGDIAVAQMYSSDALQASRKTGGKVEFIFPAEGATMAVDNLVIPKAAKHPNAAHALIDFLLSVDVGVAQVQGVMSGPIQRAVAGKLSAELRNNKTLFPDVTLLSKFEMMQDIGDASSTYDRIWTELKAM